MKKGWYKRIFNRSTKARPTPIPDWTADIAVKEKLTLADAKFIFDQAEKLLNDSVVTSETIVSRMNTLITLITASLLALSGYVISRLMKDFSWTDPLIFTSLVGIGFLYVLAIFSFHNNEPKDYLIAGAIPIDLFDEAFFAPTIPNDQRILRYYINAAENYVKCIATNNEINDKRWRRYSMISKGILCLPPILLICYVSTI